MDSRKSSPSAIMESILPLSSLEKMPNSFFCKTCKMIMLEVYQLVCGHLICKCCKEKLEKDCIMTCPDDPSCLNTDTLYISKIFEDRFSRRCIQGFKTECINAEFGCSWFGNLVDYASHYEECIAKFEEPIEGLQQSRMTMVADPIVTCPYCQNIQLPTNELLSHIEHECIKAGMSCPFKDIGCPEHERQTRKNLEDHARIATEIHLDLLLRDHLSLQGVSYDGLYSLYTVSKQVGQLQNNVKQLNTNLTVLSSECDSRCHQLDKTNSDILSQVPALKLCSQRSMADNLETRLNNLEAVLACFQEEVTGTAPAGNLEQRVSALERAVENVKAQEQRLLRLQKQLEFVESRMENLEVQCNSNEVTSVFSQNGPKDAKDSFRPDPNSSSFQRPKEGIYIASQCPVFQRVYMNRDGQGKVTHLSVFFTVLKGSYDPLLPWPLKQMISPSIASQNGPKDVEDSFRPDPNSVSFQRPQQKANISSGCRLCPPKPSLENDGFIQDDCMFLKAKVEGSEEEDLYD